MTEKIGAVYEYLAKMYGGLVATRESTVVVAVTRTELVGNNPDRVELTFCNVGPEAAFVFTSFQDFASGVGIRIGPSGGLMTVNVVEDSVLPSLGWRGKASPNPTTLFMMEVIRETSTGN